MPKFFIHVLLIFAFFLVGYLNHTNAAVTAEITPSTVDENSPSVTVRFKDLSPNTEYEYCGTTNAEVCSARKRNVTADSNGIITLDNMCAQGEHLIERSSSGCGSGDFFWGGVSYSVRLFTSFPRQVGEAKINVNRIVPSFNISSDNGFKPGSNITATVKGSRRPMDNTDRNSYKIEITGAPNPSNNTANVAAPNNNEVSHTFGALSIIGGHYTAKLVGRNHESIDGHTFATVSFDISSDGGGITGTSNNGEFGSGKGSNPCSTTECETAIGNLPVSLKGLADKILQIAIGVAGGIALILIVIGAIRVLVSGGDPQKVNGGREMIIAAVSGLIFLIFTTVILEFLGVNILGGIPGIDQ